MRRTKRALRRHHKERIKNKRQHYWFGKEFMDERKLGIVASTPAPCNCWQCKNPRRVFKGKDKLTVQELRHKMW